MEPHNTSCRYGCNNCCPYELCLQGCDTVSTGSSFWLFEGLQYLYLHCQESKFFLNCLTPRIKAIWSFKTSGTNRPITVSHHRKVSIFNNTSVRTSNLATNNDDTHSVHPLCTDYCSNSRHITHATKITVNHLCRYFNGLLLCMEWPIKICTIFLDLPFLWISKGHETQRNYIPRPHSCLKLSTW